MLRRLPPLNAIKAFEAAARSESFTRAAEELRVTPGAVGHQVKALEGVLGVRLFRRERQRLVLNGPGREYLGVGRDRKSTRLNSNHANISYAVLCFKKKKNRRAPRR